MTKGVVTEATQVDTKVLLKHVVDDDAMSKFEKFVQGYLGIHDRFDFHLMYNFDEHKPIASGFASDSSRVFVLTNHSLLIFDVDKDAGTVTLGAEYAQEGIIAGDQHPARNGIFVLVTKQEIILVDVFDMENASALQIEHVIAAKFVADGKRLLCLTANGILNVISLTEGHIGELELFDGTLSDNLQLCVHESEPCAIVVNGTKLAFVELSEQPKLKVVDLKKEPTAVSFLPDKLFGAALGFADGSMCLYSFESSKSVVEQKVGKVPIAKIAFCPDRNDIVAIAIGGVLCFGGIPQWGFGSFNVYAKYEQHLATLRDVSWCKDDTGLSIATCDESGMFHMFEVPQEYLQLY